MTTPGKNRSGSCREQKWVAIDADYREPHGGFRAVKMTLTWAENGQPRQHVHVARQAEETLAITCAVQPVMKALVLELAE